jgi:uncharacterized radical SAM superfamily Fe-S cluster-containing enzyme
LINITGGEPTLHPSLPDLLARCARRSFGRVSVNTNGLKIAESEDLALRLRDTGAQLILSLDTLDPGASVIIHGADITGFKLRALERLSRLSIPTVLLPVWIPGLNDNELPGIIKEYLQEGFIKGVTIQTIAYTGHNGGRFQPRERATLEDVEKGLEAAGIGPDSFFSHGSYHPLCYSVAYFLIDSVAKLPLSALADHRTLTAATAGGYLMRATGELVESLREGVDRLWAEGAPKEKTALVRKLVGALAGGGSGGDRRREIERTGLIKTVTIHAHMDEENFDLARVQTCGDLVPEEDGQFRPACSYNLVYRSRDPRFWAEAPSAGRPLAG